MNKINIMGSIVLISGLLFAGHAAACCVYNKTSINVKAHLDCSGGSMLHPCDNKWDLLSQSHACRPNKGGVVEVCKTFNVGDGYCHFDVSDHGYLKIYEETSRYKLVNHADDGSVSDLVYIKK